MFLTYPYGFNKYNITAVLPWLSTHYVSDITNYQITPYLHLCWHAVNNGVKPNESLKANDAPD